jgi:hypothetical protein
MRFVLLLALLVPAGPALAQAPVTESGFEFHSGFWINLHHFLYQQAFWRKAAAAEKLAKTDKLSDAQRREWSLALDYYAASMIDRDLLFDDGMVAIKTSLAAAEGKPSLAGSGLDEKLVGALERAAPVYRAAWWPEHDRLNRAWIEAVRPLVRKYHDGLAPKIAAAFREKWPPEPIRVDVTFFAHRVGAYTTDNPLHVTISSTHPSNQGEYALEILFHEATHALVDTNAGAVGLAIAREAKARNRPVPDRLWHTVLFFTTGELVRRAYEGGGVKGYVPYAYKFGLYERSPEAGTERRALEAYWLPYLDGKLSFDDAVSRLVEAVLAP